MEVVSANWLSMPPVATPAGATTPENPGGGEGEGTTTVELEDTPASIPRKVAWEFSAAEEVSREGGAVLMAASTLVIALTTATESCMVVTEGLLGVVTEEEEEEEVVPLPPPYAAERSWVTVLRVSVEVMPPPSAKAVTPLATATSALVPPPPRLTAALVVGRGESVGREPLAVAAGVREEEAMEARLGMGVVLPLALKDGERVGWESSV